MFSEHIFSVFITVFTLNIFEAIFAFLQASYSNLFLAKAQLQPIFFFFLKDEKF